MPDGAYLRGCYSQGIQRKSKPANGRAVVTSGPASAPESKAKRSNDYTGAVNDYSHAGKKVRVNDGDDAISIFREGKERAVVVAAHDGTDGQVSSTSGALTFRTGNVFSNQEQEQMRVTADGRVGIGTKNPEATLDVAGTIKARGGIQFEDGTVLSSAKN